LCSDNSGSGVQEGSNNGALALSIFPLMTAAAAAAAAAMKTVPRHYQSSLAREMTAVVSA
jgi:hypothetical protein